MSELSPEQILELIDESGPEGLDLSHKDLTGIDLSSNKAAELAARYGENLPKGLFRYEDGTCCFRLFILTEEGDVVVRANLQGARLTEANLHGIDLSEANLQEVDLAGANLAGADLSGANLQKAWLWGANLVAANLMGADMTEAILYSVDLRGAALGFANLQEARLAGADLRGADFENADLQRAIFYLPALQRAQLTEIMPEMAQLEGADLREASFRRTKLTDTDFTEVESLAGAYLYGAELDRTRLYAGQLKPMIGEEKDGNWEEAKDTYLSLKNNFMSLGRYDDGRWAYVKERKMERKSFFPSQEGDKGVREKLDSLSEGSLRKRMAAAYRCWLYLKLFLMPARTRIRRLWMRNVAWEVSCEYAESVFRPICWGLLVMLVLSPPLFYFWGGIVTDSSPASYIDCIVFSMRSFATLSFTDIVSLTYFGKVWSSLEAMAGVATFALIMYTLGRRLAGV